MVLACPQGEGLSGADERNAFANQPPVPRQRTEQLKSILRVRMFPAAARGSFREFSKSVYEYGYLAGECFAASQRGPYNGPLATRIVDAIRARGVAGVGQSSWGPTIFALVENAQDGDVLARQLRRQFMLSNDEVWVSAIKRDGASIRVVNDSRIAVM
jgi:predicted sugar kinase